MKSRFELKQNYQSLGFEARVPMRALLFALVAAAFFFVQPDYNVGQHGTGTAVAAELIPSVPADLIPGNAEGSVNKCAPLSPRSDASTPQQCNQQFARSHNCMCCYYNGCGCQPVRYCVNNGGICQAYC